VAAFALPSDFCPHTIAISIHFFANEFFSPYKSDFRIPGVNQ